MDADKPHHLKNQPLSQSAETLTVPTAGPGFVEITREILQWLQTAGASDGMLTIFVRHTSASLTIQENADPDVQSDLMSALEGLAPRDGNYRHCAEGSDDMPAHIKSMVTATSLNVPVLDGRPVLGTWQGVYVIEHRDRPHRREIVLHFIGSHKDGI